MIFKSPALHPFSLGSRIGSALSTGVIVACSWGMVTWAQDYSIPKGLGKLTVPADNPFQQDKIELGRQLYFDPRLSIDNSVSCASCHDPNKGWSNGEATSAGFEGKRGGRSAPTVINSAYSKFQFWDGRAATLEEQALGPIANPIEMNLPLDEMVKKLNSIDGYRQQFQKVFQTDVTQEGVAKALAAFERTILSGDAPYDRYKAGQTDALSPAAKRGMELFFGKANCSSCHSGSNFSDGAFHNIGVGMDRSEPDAGRKAHSNLAGDTGAFKTPTLRDIDKSAPYMHDGSAATLEDVIAYYDKGGTPNQYLDEELYPLKLTSEDKTALVAFLKEGLASSNYPFVTAPDLPK